MNSIYAIDSFSHPFSTDHFLESPGSRMTATGASEKINLLIQLCCCSGIPPPNSELQIRESPTQSQIFCLVPIQVRTRKVNWNLLVAERHAGEIDSISPTSKGAALSAYAHGVKIRVRILLGMEEGRDTAKQQKINCPDFSLRRSEVLISRSSRFLLNFYSYIDRETSNLGAYGETDVTSMSCAFIASFIHFSRLRQSLVCGFHNTCSTNLSADELATNVRSTCH